MTLTKTLQLLAAVTLMGLLWAGLDGGQAMSLLQQANAGWLLAGLVALTAQTLLSAWRWQFTAHQLGQRFTIGHAIREYYLSQIVNQSLPGGVLGDAGRALRARHDGGLARSGGAVVIERALGQAALLTVLAVACLLPNRPDLPLPVQIIVTAVLVTGGAICAAIAAATLTRGSIGAAARKASSLVRRAVLQDKALPKQIALNLAITTTNIAAFAFCAHATGTAMSASQAALLVPLILLTMIVPLTISGWGIREGAAAALFPLIGATGAAGLAASTAFGLLFLVSTLPGILVLMSPMNTAPTNLQVDP
jgi:uncharacterized membrane protein YbhN (UPF0104 family)